MKKFIVYLFLISNVISFFSLSATTEKTFLSAPARTDLYFHIRDLWEQNIELKRRDHIGGRVLVTTSYRQSYDDGELGRYFGVNDNSSIVIGKRIDNAGVLIDPNVDIDKRRVIFDQAIPEANATINLKPQRSVFDFIISYEQSLDRWCNGLSARIIIPFEWVTHTLNHVVCSNNVAVGEELAKFFAGIFEQDLQQPLTKAKFSQKQSTSGISDIELAARYNLVNKQTLKLDIGLEGIIPTSNKPSGEFLFEPVRGHAGHGGIGVNMHASHLLYDDFYTTVQLMAMVQARYFFSTTHKRTVSLKDWRFGHYILLGQAGETKLLPAANVLTMPLDVNGYTEICTSFGLHGNHHGWFGSLAYQIKTREEEKLRLNCAWNNARYAVTSFSFDGSPFGSAPTDFDRFANDWITTRDLDVQAAATPGFLLHDMSLMLGKVFDFDARTVVFYVGASSEFSDRNFPAKSWMLSMGLGASF